jgi:hypothetical protein
MMECEVDHLSRGDRARKLDVAAEDPGTRGKVKVGGYACDPDDAERGWS